MSGSVDLDRLRKTISKVMAWYFKAALRRCGDNNTQVECGRPEAKRNVQNPTHFTRWPSSRDQRENIPVLVDLNGGQGRGLIGEIDVLILSTFETRFTSQRIAWIIQFWAAA